MTKRKPRGSAYPITVAQLRRWPPDLSLLPLEHQIRPHTPRRSVVGTVAWVRGRFLSVALGDPGTNSEIQVAMQEFPHGVRPGDRISVEGVLGRVFRGPMTFFVRPREEPQDDGNPFDTHETRFGVLGTPEGKQARWRSWDGWQYTPQQMGDFHLASVLCVLLRRTCWRLGMGTLYGPLLSRPDDAMLFMTRSQSAFTAPALAEWERRGLPWWGTFRFRFRFRNKREG